MQYEMATQLDELPSKIVGKHFSSSSKSGLEVDKVLANKSIPDDRKWLCRDTLRQLLTSGSLEDLTRKHSAGYPIFLGQIEDVLGISWFHCKHLPHALLLSGLPCYGWRKSGNKGKKGYLLAHKVIEGGGVIYQPLFLWPEGEKCDPYIITAQHPFLMDTENRVLGVKDGTSGSVKCYSYNYDVVYTQNGKKTMKEFLKILNTSFYAAVVDTFPSFGERYIIEGEILILTSSYRLALAGISTLVGNYTVGTQDEEKVASTQEEFEEEETCVSEGLEGEEASMGEELEGEEASIDGELEGEASMGEELEGEEASIYEELEGEETSMGEELEGEEASIYEELEGEEASMGEELEGEEASMGEELEGVEASIDDELEGVEASIDDELEGVEASIDDKLEGEEASIDEELEGEETSKGEEASMSEEQEDDFKSERKRETNTMQTNSGKKAPSVDQGHNPTKVKSDVTNIQVTISMPTKIACYACRCVVNEKDFLVLMANDMMILALKKDFYKDSTIPEPSDWKRRHLKKLSTGISVYAVNVTKPVRLEKRKITHLAVMSYIGKKPTEADNIIARWREGKIERNTTLHIDAKDGLKLINICFKLDISLISEVESKSQKSGYKVMKAKQTQASTSSAGQAKKNYPQPAVENIEVSVNISSKIESLVCQCVVVEKEFLVLMAKEMIILALKNNFYKRGVKTPPSCSLGEQLKNMPGTGVSVLSVKVTKPVKVEELPITHFAVVAYIGRKPSAADDIIARWKKGKRENNITVHIDGNEGLKVVNFSIKLEYSLQPKLEDVAQEPGLKTMGPHQETGGCETPVSNQGKQKVKPEQLGLAEPPTRPPATSKPYVRLMTYNRGQGRTVETNCAGILHLGKETGILEVTHEIIEGKVNIFFTRDTVYINKEALCKTQTLASCLKPIKSEPFSCVARIFPNKNKSKPRTICGVQVHFIANLVWYGEKPIKEKAAAQDVESGAVVSPASKFKPTMMSVKSTLLTPLPRDTKTGHVMEVHQVMGRLKLEDGQCVYFPREKCFLFGVSLNKVDLWHILSINDKVAYKMAKGMLKVSGVWVGGKASLNPAHLPSILDRWCRFHNIAEVPRVVLLMEAGWLSPDLNPLADPSQDKEIIDVH